VHIGWGKGAVACAAATGLAIFVPASAFGFGTFEAADAYETGGLVYGIAVGDLNRDGVVDILAGNDDGDDHISLLLGKGNGTFKAEKRIRDRRGPEGVAIGQFGGDRRKDFAVADYDEGDNTSRVSIFVQRKRNRFRRADTMRAGPGAWLLEAADLNRDRRIDLVTGNYDSDGSDAVSVLLGKRRGGFKPHVDYAGPTGNVKGLALGRMDDDKRLDVVATGGDGTVMIRRTRTNGTLASAEQDDFTAATTGYDVTLGAFDANPGLDIAAPLASTGQVMLIGGDDDGGFGPAAPILSGTAAANGIATGDLEGDGQLDVAVGQAGGGFIAEFGNDTGSFTFVPGDDYDGSAAPEIVETARLNRDAGLDVVVGHDGGIDVFLNEP